AEFLLDYASVLTFPVLKADKHYSLFIFPGERIFFLSEGVTVTLLLLTTGILLGFFLLYSVGNNAALLFHLRHFLKYFWIFILLLPLLVVSIKFSGQVYSFLLRFLHPSSAAINNSAPALVLFLAFFAFFLPSPLLDLIHFPRRAQFYGFSAVLITLIGMLFTALLDFSYIPIFLWTFIFISLGAFFSNTILIFICIIMAPLMEFSALINIIESGSQQIAQLIISLPWNTLDNWMTSIQAALITLPIFLLIGREIILIQKIADKGVEKKPKRKYRLIAIPLGMILICTGMILQIVLVPKKPYEAERRYIAEGPGTGMAENNPLQVSLEDTLFQNSRIITLQMNARGSPVRFDVSLESINGQSLLPVYSAPVPFDREDEGRRISFSLGEYAPDPLIMEIVLPENFEGALKTEAVYNTWDPEIDKEKESISNDYILRVSRTITLQPVK
ncbi:MAG: hypothetical protein FWF26_02285, partial [Treponema sp.]|nr:hypothetical protein [Treponema sp.]